MRHQLLDLHVETRGLGVNIRLCDLLAVGLVASIVLQLDVKVQTALAAIDFGAALVRAREPFLNLVGASPVMTFPTIVKVALR